MIHGNSEMRLTLFLWKHKTTNYGTNELGLPGLGKELRKLFSGYDTSQHSRGTITEVSSSKTELSLQRQNVGLKEPKYEKKFHQPMFILRASQIFTFKVNFFTVDCKVI